jgi:hypothetical protein
MDPENGASLIVTHLVTNEDDVAACILDSVLAKRLHQEL